MERRLRALIEQRHYRTVVFPAGLFHDDHMHLHEAVLRIRDALPQLNWLLYEDCLYRQISGLLQQRLNALSSRGITATPIRFASSGDWHERKRLAVLAYGSQLKGLDLPSIADSDLEQAERYWWLE